MAAALESLDGKKDTLAKMSDIQEQFKTDEKNATSGQSNSAKETVGQEDLVRFQDPSSNFYQPNLEKSGAS